jgi:hypothetical protein
MSATTLTTSSSELCQEAAGVSLALLTTERPERGYSATNHNAIVVKLQKPLRCQFGEKCDATKVQKIIFNDAD